MTTNLTLVVCGAPLASRSAAVAAELVKNGWTVTVVGSPASRQWLDEEAVKQATGRPALFEQRRADQARGPRPDAVVACPLTMNSGSKAASGIMDTYATGVLCDALAMRLPMTIVVMVSSRLWTHPAWSGHLASFAERGARFVSPLTGRADEAPEPVQSGSGPDVVSTFDPIALAGIVGEPALS
jgi:phosphopantothenoylcysteine synthetase/decarboxylase